MATTSNGCVHAWRTSRRQAGHQIPESTLSWRLPNWPAPVKLWAPPARMPKRSRDSPPRQRQPLLKNVCRQRFCGERLATAKAEHEAVCKATSYPAFRPV